MAESITRRLGGHNVHAVSAGLSPLGWIAEPTLRALEAKGFPTDGLSSKGIGEVPIDDIDVVVSLIGDHGLAVLPAGMGARKEAWAIPDPYGEDDVVYSSVLQELELRIARLLADEFQGELLLS